MNERIKNFYDQVGIDFENFQRVTVTKGDMEKFAELIVRDCMDVVDGYTKGRTFETHYDAVAQIEALFGIKHNGVEL